jgi:hypothetical protein
MAWLIGVGTFIDGVGLEERIKKLKTKETGFWLDGGT